MFTMFYGNILILKHGCRQSGGVGLALGILNNPADASGNYNFKWLVLMMIMLITLIPTFESKGLASLMIDFIKATHVKQPFN